MRVQYIITQEEVSEARRRLAELKRTVAASRRAGYPEDSKAFDLKAKGFEEALIMLGVVAPEKRVKGGKND